MKIEFIKDHDNPEHYVADYLAIYKGYEDEPFDVWLGIEAQPNGWQMRIQGDIVGHADTLKQAQAQMPELLRNHLRHNGEDPVLIEHPDEPEIEPADDIATAMHIHFTQDHDNPEIYSAIFFATYEGDEANPEYVYLFIERRTDSWQLSVQGDPMGHADTLEEAKAQMPAILGGYGNHYGVKVISMEQDFTQPIDCDTNGQEHTQAL